MFAAAAAAASCNLTNQEVEQELVTTKSALNKAREQLEEVQAELENEKAKSAELQTLAEEAIAQAEGATGQVCLVGGWLASSCGTVLSCW